ncbi:4-(cytidine 5'-diphospho)-2-C-methyl-D-erythritol kinase [Nemorincola caseinilytica]|uniref:4-diphosphocytidyl-2-C-methyl-D-erythritol kinase n=1 Tax=Nemorincola caseinilytica TaxID=2054315 RepID=A0ABP8N8B2_9BACT
MVCFPNCKINLGLFVTARRSDGYHDLATVFYPLTPVHFSPGREAAGINENDPVLNDVLEVAPATTGTAQLHMSGLPVSGDKNDNLVWKAYTLLQRHHGDKVPPLDIYLHKATPMGAGLGGGSADGAYMLQLLNDQCGLGLTREELAAYALQLGSDCPFFIYNTPQYATGRGEVMEPVSIDLSAYRIKVICPGIHVSTRDAFAQITPRPAPFALRQISTLPIAEWRHHILNDFEKTVFAIHPQIAAIKQQLYDEGALYASMTGTGSAVYGIFENAIM